jgi:release factor glutamine methyltransferase
VDVVTIHPPYIARGEVRTLPRELCDFEPLESLTDQSRDGLELARRAIEEARGWLRPGGWLLVEIGSYMARGVAAELRRAGYSGVRSTCRDPRLTRVVLGKRATKV